MHPNTSTKRLQPSYAVAGLSLLALFGHSPYASRTTSAVPASLEVAPDTGAVASTGATHAPTQWCDSIIVAVDTIQGGRRVPVVTCTSTLGDSLALQRARASVARALLLYGNLTGVPYPESRYLLQSKPTGPAGEGFGISITDGQNLTGDLPDRRAERDRPAIVAKVVVHEVAHQWFASIVKKAEDRSAWLGEGFADFMTAQFWQVAYGPQAEEEFLFFYNSRWDSSPIHSSIPAGAGTPAAAVTPEEAGEGAFPEGLSTIPKQGFTTWEKSLDTNDGPYYRGALVLWMLKQYLGDTRFWPAVHTYLMDNAGKMAYSEDFQRAVEKSAGENMDWFFKEWVFGTGYPQFTVAATYNATAHQVAVHVTQVAPVFRMPVTVRVGTAKGDVLAHAILDTLTQTITIDHVDLPPTFVVFDDSDAIVKTLQFEQPTRWLAVQVQRETRPWQTWWAIDQLGRRGAHDTVAAKTLMTAALHGRYALTRAQAMVALGDAATPAAVATLQQGLRDTSVVVRRGVLKGLWKIGTPATREIERSVFQHDSSDIVRDHALLNLFTSPAIQQAERQALFAQALSQQTYNNTIDRDAIMTMLVAEKHKSAPGCDSSLVTALREHLAYPGVVTIVRQLMSPGMFGFMRPALPVPQCKGAFKALLAQADSAGGRP